MVATLTAVSTLSFAQKVVTTEKTGQLETLIKESERENTPSLKVVGPINGEDIKIIRIMCCLLYTSPSPRDYAASRMPSSA